MAHEPSIDDTALGTKSAELEVGLHVFRQYVLKRFLGRGPLGSAWLVVHEGIGRELAMRFVPGGWLRDERVMSRLRDTVVRLLEITHPGLVGILDFVRDAQAAAIVSKFVDAETVLEAKARRPDRCFEIEMLRPWFSQACEALDFAWRQHQATHGDLAPGNLLVTVAGELKIADFGLARNLTDLEAPSSGPLIAVNLAHASPERAKGAAVTVADDVYGLGATLYDLITGRAPFFRGNIRWQLESVVPPTIAERRAELNIAGDLIPPEWEEVIRACLEKLPENRPATVREVGERLGLLNPMNLVDQMPHAMVLPRPAETVVGLRLPPRTPLGPVPEFPTTVPTAPKEPPTMVGATIALQSGVPTPPPPPPSSASPDAEPQGEFEAAPATVDENFDLEATVSQLPPVEASELPKPEAATSQPNDLSVPSAVSEAEALPATPAMQRDPDFDLMETVAADDPPSLEAIPQPEEAGRASVTFVPPPGIVPNDEAEATLAAEEPLARPTPSALGPNLEAELETTRRQVSPEPSCSVPTAGAPHNLEESVTFITPAPRRVDTAAPPPPLVGEASTAAPAFPLPPNQSSAPPLRPPINPRWWWLALPLIAIVVGMVGAFLGHERGEKDAGASPPAPLTPPPHSSPTAHPTTPAPAPPPTPAPAPAARVVASSDLTKLPANGVLNEKTLLIGEFRVSTSTPPTGSRPGTAVMRPSDSALSGQIRLIATFGPSQPTPAEGSTIALTAESRFFVKEIHRGADGQLNVHIDQR